MAGAGPLGSTRRNDERLRADPGRGLPRPRRSDALPQADAGAGRVPGGDRHPVVVRARGARVRARPARDPAVRGPQRSHGHHRPGAGGRPLLHPMPGGDVRRRYLHVHRRADARRRVRGRADLAPGAPAGGRAPGRRDRGRTRRPPPADDGHAPGVAAGPRPGSAAADRLTMVGRGVRRQGVAGAQPRSLHLARPRHRRRKPGPARRARHRGGRVPGPGPLRQRHPASHGDLGRR